MTELLSNIGNFALYFGSAIALLFIFKVVYAFVTPHDEWLLIKDQQNTAASIAFGGAIVGFAIAVGGAASNSVAYLDFVVWALLALVAQLLAFVILKLTLCLRSVNASKTMKLLLASCWVWCRWPAFSMPLV